MHTQDIHHQTLQVFEGPGCNGQGLPQPIVDNRGENSLVPCSALVGLEVVEESTCILIDQEITWLGIYIYPVQQLFTN